MEVTPEIARIHAHICGDGSVYMLTRKRSKGELIKHKRRDIYRKEYCIEYYNNDNDLIKEFVTDFNRAFKRNKKIIRNKIIFKGVKSIIEKLEVSNKNSYSWFIPDFITRASSNIISSWIRAFFDDEAYINPSRKRILVKCMNKKGLQQIIQLFQRLGIKSNITGPNCDNSYYLVIKEKSLFKYRDKIGFLMKRKSNLLDDITKNMGREELS